MHEGKHVYELAFEDYVNGMKFKDISAKYNVSESTVRSWKNRYWKDGTLQRKAKGAATKKGRRCNEKRNAAKAKNASNSEKQIDATDESLCNVQPENAKSKTNSQSQKARYGNQNALGNRGGPGGTKGNKRAVTTHEFETLYFQDVDDKTKQLLSYDDYFDDEYSLLVTSVKDLVIREVLIKRDIEHYRNIAGGMILQGITKTGGRISFSNTIHNKNGETWQGNESTQDIENTVTSDKGAHEHVLRLEEALTRVQGKKLQAIAQMYKMNADRQRIEIDLSKLDIYRQKLSGKIDLDLLLGDEGVLDNT